VRLLVIEDEPKTGEYLRQGLREAGFAVVLATTGQDGHHLATGESFDLIIVDVMLPDIDGFRVVQMLRQEGGTCPVLFLTARDRVDDRVKGLEIGGDDYLGKPFAFSELLARVRMLIRRGAAKSVTHEMVVADLVLEPLKRRVSRAGKRLLLTQREFSLLELLMRREGEVLPRSIIASEVWDMNFESDTNVIDVAIRRLRAKVDDEYPLKLIHTIRGFGYTLRIED